MRGELHAEEFFWGQCASCLDHGRTTTSLSNAHIGVDLPVRPGRQLTQQRSSPPGCHVASDGHTHAHISDPFIIYLVFIWYCFVIYSLFFVVAGRPQACLQRRPDKPRLNRLAWRPWQRGSGQCTAYARVVACSLPSLPSLG